MRERRVPFQGVQNFRDLGGFATRDGGQTRWGRVFRADGLHKLTAADLEQLERLHLRAVYDLRGEAEREEHPNPIESVHLSIVGRPVGDAAAPLDRSLLDAAADGERMLRDLYVGACTHSAEPLGRLFTALGEPEGTPAVFHCHGGKDRTGIAAALLLLALGVDRADVLDDYEATRRYRLLDHQQDSLANLLASGMSPEAAVGVLGTPRWAMADALDAVDAEHGGIDAYLTGPAGMTAAALARLRAALVESG